MSLLTRYVCRRHVLTLTRHHDITRTRDAAANGVISVIVGWSGTDAADAVMDGTDARDEHLNP